jgi:hypothetical protein
MISQNQLQVAKVLKVAIYLLLHRRFGAKRLQLHFNEGHKTKKKLLIHRIYIRSVGTGVSSYPRAIRSKTYRDYVKPRIIPNATYNVIFV